MIELTIEGFDLRRSEEIEFPRCVLLSIGGRPRQIQHQGNFLYEGR